MIDFYFNVIHLLMIRELIYVHAGRKRRQAEMTEEERVAERAKNASGSNTILALIS
jgi:hypothetical protein